MGLAGGVETADLEALLSGHDPRSGKQLGTALVDRHRPDGRVVRAVAGFDATFSSPKSLSVWWGLTGDPGLLEAHDAAVEAVLQHLERFGATTRVRVGEGRQHPDVDGLIMAAFRQATSREDDPQLHTHVVVSSKVLAPDGRWMALDARYLKRHQRALGALYQSVLRAELSHRYGVAWGPIDNGQAEIAGAPRELLEAYSKRSEQVDAALAEKVAGFRQREGRDPTRWERAALKREAAADTRSTKSGAAVEGLGRRWSEEAADLGWNADRLVASMRSAAQNAPVRETLTVGRVIEELSTKGSCWTRADVLQAVCDLAPPASHLTGRQWAQAVEAACDQVITACQTLDPLADNTPVRVSDGRSVWVAPTEPYLTTEAILAQEERILAFAMAAQDPPPRPSVTVDREGLDVLQAEAAAAVAGDDELVLIVGPAGTGKTTALRRAVEELQRNGFPVFGVAPSAKAAKVLRCEVGMTADTVAKLLYEWRSDGPPRDVYRLPTGATLVVDEAGMVGTADLDELVALATSQCWRVVLVGDPRQLQAVGRGGLFDEFCRTGRVHELSTIHRFHHRWERIATRQLRGANPKAVDAYLDHGRVDPGVFDDLTHHAARLWVERTAAGRTVAIVAETNEHVDRLNSVIQQHRRTHGHLGDDAVPIAGGETAAVGDIVATRRNDRTLVTDRDEPVRNRDRWEVTAVGSDGSLALSRVAGQGLVTLPADYARSHVRLGYAVTAHGHQGDTVDIGLAIVTAATTHRGLYVGATRGRYENRLLVVTDEPDLLHARDVLEQVLTNERADIPAVAQRRNLAARQPRTGWRTQDSPHPPTTPTATTPTSRATPQASVKAAERRLAAARNAFDEAKRLAQPVLRSVRGAETAMRAAEDAVGAHRFARTKAAPWRRRRITYSIRHAGAEFDDAHSRLDDARSEAAPHLARIEAAEDRVRDAERDVRIARGRAQLERMTQPDLTAEPRDHGIDLDGPGS
jgi:conjugative relaxase-like TrwC/TraI family protein